MADGSGTDFSINGSLTIQSNSNPVASGTLRYNTIEDRFEGLINKTNSFNGTRWAPVSLDTASASSLGGIKVGNNLSITSTGVLNASAESISRKFQKVLMVSQQPDTGDYLSISQAVNNFFQYDSGSGNFNGEISGLDKSKFPDPDENNRYIIYVTPGIYQESGATIDLPPYVSLVGDKKDECIVKINTSTQFNCHTGSHIINLTLDVSQSTTGISVVSGNTANNVIVENVNFTSSTLSGDTTMINASGVTGLKVENCNSAVVLGSGVNNNLNFLTASGVSGVLKNNNVSFQSYIGSKNILNASSTSNFEIENCQFVSEELNTTTTAHTNSIITCDNSTLDIQYSKIESKGYDLEIGTDTHYNRGITFSSNTPLSTSDQSSVTFLHYEDESQYDKISIPTTGNTSFIATLSSGSLIKVSGATNSQNNDIFTITDIFESGANTIIQLKYDDILVDEVFTSSGTDITMKTLYTITAFASQFMCVNETLYFDSSSGNTDNYRLQASQCNLDGRDPIVGNNVIVFRYPQEINVGKEDCDFASIRLAMDSITDSSSVKPYIVNVKAGRYQETGTITIPQYVSLKGDTPNSVVIVFEGNNGSYPNNMAISVSNNVILQNFRMEIPGLLDGTSGVSELVGIGSVNQVGITIGNTVSEDTATNLSGIQINNVEIDIASSVALANKTCVHLFKTSYHSRNVKLVNHTSDTLVSTQNIVGWKQTLGNGEVSHLEVVIEGNENNINAYGIFADRALLNTHHPDVLCKCNGGLNVVNRGYYATNVADTDGTNSNKSEKTNIIYNGYLRSYDGTTNYGLYTANNATLFSVGSTIEGTNFSFNDANNSVPNSFLKTVDSYAFITQSNNITNITALDNYGGSSVADGNLGLGDEVGTIGSTGNKNISVGIRVGTLNTAGSRNILMGVDTGNKMTSGDENVMIGVDAGNISLGDRNTLLGDASGSKMVNGNDNTFLGHHSGKEMVGGSRNVLLGGNVASTSTNMYDDIVIGYQSGTSMNNGNTNIIMGNNSAGALTIGSNNLLLGHDTARSITTSNENVLVGNLGGKDATTVLTSVLMGHQTGTNFNEIVDNVIIGHQAGQGGSGAIGQKNVVIGARAGNSMTTSNENVIIGTAAASRLTTGGKNIIIGSESQNDIYSSPASNLTTGSDNIIMGNDVAVALTTGRKNIILGNASGKKLDETNDTIIMGYGSGGNISGSADSDGKNIIIGNESALNITSGRAIIIGHGSGTKSTGDDIMVIGNEAGRTVEGPRNTLIGNYAGGISDSTNYPIKGADNVLIGTYSGYSLSEGSHNVIIGSGDSINGGSGYDITSGDGNMIMGYRAGRQLTTGDFNVLFGKNAGNKVNNGNRNIVIGNDAGKELGSVGSNNDDNLILGNEAGYNYTNASGLLLMGQRAGYTGVSGQDNTYVGNDSGYENVSGARNTLIGSKAGYKNTDSDNTMIGVSAGEYSTTAQQNTFIGQYAGRGKGAGVADNNTGDQNTYIGYETGSNTTTGYQNITMGFRAGKSLDTGAKNIMVGPNAGLNSGTASKNIFIGTAENDSLGVGMNTTGNFNTFIGVDTGLNNTSGAENISIGSHAGKENTTGDNNINIGDDAGQNITTGDNNINIGKQAGDSIVDGARNIVIGSEAGNNMGTGVNDNIIMGARAGQNNAVDNSIFIGKDAGKLNASGVGNILIGPKAGSSMSQNRDNIMIGSNAGAGFNRTTDTQGENIYIGPEAGSQNVTGIQNIIIGSEAFSRSTQGSGVIAIGYQAGNNAGVLSDNLGSAYENTIIGFQAGSGGDMSIDNVIIGSKAAKNVDNARKFRGNLLMGTEAGKNSNLAINSVVVGSANKEGTGGDTNIMMGTSAGDKVGNPIIPKTVPRTVNSIVANQISVIINLPLSTALYYFKVNDKIFIEDDDRSNFFETEISTILKDTTASPNDSRCKIVFKTPYTNSQSIDANATIFSLSIINNDKVGELDNSKSSANTLLGTGTGSNVTIGSKNVALGSEAMINNKIGKYNNILGTQAGYNLRSDNNTCFGTRAGYSLDLYTNTNNTTGTDFTFTANTNTISSTNQNLSSYDFGTVFEIEGSSKNNGRFIVESATTNNIIVEGLPSIDELGVPITIDDENLIVTGSSLNFISETLSARDLKIVNDVVTVDSVTNNYNGIGFVANISQQETKVTTMTNAGIIRISGSKYNDGVYYPNTTDILPTGDVKLAFETADLYPETFSTSASIVLNSINVSSLTSENNYNDYLGNMPFFTFFGVNKGKYNVSSYMSKYPSSKPFNSSDTQLNNVIIHNSTKTDIIGETNLTFIVGTTQSIVIGGSENSDTYLSFYNKISNGVSFSFFSANNNIISSDNNDKFTYDNQTSGYVNVKDTSNNNKLLKISNIVGTKYFVDSNYSITDETVATTTQLNFGHAVLKKIRTDLSDDLVQGDLINVSYEQSMGTEMNGGVFLVDNLKTNSSGNDILLNDTQIITPIYDTISKDQVNSTSDYPTPLQKNVNLRINKVFNKVNSAFLSDTSKFMHGYDLIFQVGTITPFTDGNTFTINTTSNIITSTEDFNFSKLVAPVMIKANSNYYLVKRNKYPFTTLEIDADQTPLSVAGEDFFYGLVHHFTPGSSSLSEYNDSKLEFQQKTSDSSKYEFTYTSSAGNWSGLTPPNNSDVLAGSGWNPSGLTGLDEVISIQICNEVDKATNGFNYFGTSYSTLNLSTNGNIQFGTSETDYFSSVSRFWELKMIAFLWDDFDISSSSSDEIKYGFMTTNNSNDTMVIAFINVPEFINSANNNNNIQIRLFLNNAISSLRGKIEFCYGELNTETSDEVTIGISNGISGENITFNNYTSTVGAAPGATYYEYGVGYQYTNNETSKLIGKKITFSQQDVPIDRSKYNFLYENGQSWTDTPPAETDVSSWTTISLDDDAVSSISPTELSTNNFNYYNTNYSSISIISNGNLQFGSSNSAYSDSLSELWQYKMISFLWNDLNPTLGGTVKYGFMTTNNTNDTLVIAFINIRQYGNPTQVNSVQIKLFLENAVSSKRGNIELLYGNINFSSGQTFTIGINGNTDSSSSGTTIDFSTITATTSADSISFRSVSSLNNSVDLSNMEANKNYKIFGNDLNNDVTISPVPEVGTITRQSVYLTDNSDITNMNTNNTIISLETNSSIAKGYRKGYFKNAQFTSNISFKYVGPTEKYIYLHDNAILTYNGTPANPGTNDFIRQNDIININTSNPALNTLYQVTGAVDTTATIDYIVKIPIDNSSISSDSIQYNTSTVKINEFVTLTDSEFSFRDVKRIIGDNSKFLRFGKVREESIDDNINMTFVDKTLNFTTSNMAVYEDTIINTNSYHIVALDETVPNEFVINDSEMTKIASNYCISIGTPVKNANGNDAQEILNINEPHIGTLDLYFDDGSNLANPQHTIIDTSKQSIKGTFTYNATSNTIVLSNMSFDNNSTNDINKNTIGYNDTLTEAFRNLKPDMYIRIVNDPDTTDASVNFNETYCVDELTNFSEYMSINVKDTSNAVSETFNFDSSTSNTKFTISIRYLNRDNNISLSGNDRVLTGQILSDRYDFTEFSNINITGQNTVDLTYASDKYLLIHKLPILNIKSIYTSDYYYDNYKIPDSSFANTTDIVSNVNDITSSFPFSYGGNIGENSNNKTQLIDKFNHTWIIPTDNLTSTIENTNLNFRDIFVNGNYEYNHITNTINYISGENFLNFNNNNIIKISNTTQNNGFYLINNVLNNGKSITLDTTYNTLNNTETKTSLIETNSINSTDTSITDLSVYNPGQKLIVTNTSINNNVYTIRDDIKTTNASLYLFETVNTESPSFCKLEKVVLEDEISVFTDTDNTTNFVNSSNSVVTSNSNVDFFDFVPNQTIVVTSTSNNNDTYTIANIIPTQTTLVLAVAPVNETGTNPTISKQIKLIKVGETVTTTTDAGLVKFHYNDAQGNNMMLGSFTGQFAGANGLSIHNTYIGNKVGQTNQGSGNVLIGNETGFATDYTQGASTFNNKFAIYKNNFIGVPNNPLIGGDFASGRVGINTINPDSLTSATLDTTTKLIVNGAVRASAHNTFTGTHIIHLEDKIVPNIQPGMIVRSTGQVEKKGVIDTIVSCELTSKANDKRVYGVYCHSDNVSYEEKNENTGELQKLKETLYYCASVGEGCILVSTINGELENGDYISSSPISGYGQLQDDDFLHSYTVAKITEDIDWSTVNSTHSYEGKKYKFALVSCSYHCG